MKKMIQMGFKKPSDGDNCLKFYSLLYLIQTLKFRSYLGLHFQYLSMYYIFNFTDTLVLISALYLGLSFHSRNQNLAFFIFLPSLHLTGFLVYSLRLFVVFPKN